MGGGVAKANSNSKVGDEEIVAFAARDAYILF